MTPYLERAAKDLGNAQRIIDEWDEHHEDCRSLIGLAIAAALIGLADSAQHILVELRHPGRTSTSGKLKQ